MSLPGNVPSGSPYTIPPEPTLSQNPLSIMMSRMSKFAMPSSTPLYHDAIKTVASSDDDSPPARSPNLPSVNNGRTLNYLKYVLIAFKFVISVPTTSGYFHTSLHFTYFTKACTEYNHLFLSVTCRYGNESPRQSTYDGTWKCWTHVCPQPSGYESNGIPASLPWHAPTDALSQCP